MSERVTWLWPVSILVGFPIGGLGADLVVDGVDSMGAAIIAGLIAGAIIGRMARVAPMVLVALDPGDERGNGRGPCCRRGHGRLRISRVDLALMVAVTGLGVGVMQALVFARHRIHGAVWWLVSSPADWAFGWFVSSFVIARNIAELAPTDSGTTEDGI